MKPLPHPPEEPIADGPVPNNWRMWFALLSKRVSDLVIAAGGAGTVTSVAAVSPNPGLFISGSPITTTGTLTVTLDNDVAAIEALSGTGLARRTGADTWALDSSTYLTTAGLADVLAFAAAHG